MTPSRFFRTVWRVNGVLVLLCFVLGLGAVAVELLSELSFGGGEKAAEPVAGRTVDGDPLELGDLEAVTGTPHVLLPLSSRGEASKLSSGGEPSVTRNLLFYDTGTGATRWLRPDHRAAIAARAFVHAPGPPGREEDGPVRFVRYELAESDADGDGEITDADAVSVAVSGPGGDGLAVVLAGADAILGYRELDGGAALLVFFRRGAEHLVARVDLASRRVVRTTRLPAP